MLYSQQRPLSFFGFPQYGGPDSYYHQSPCEHRFTFAGYEPTPSREEYYQHVAEEHHRQAQVALRLAQREHDRAVERQRQARAESLGAQHEAERQARSRAQRAHRQQMAQSLFGLPASLMTSTHDEPHYHPYARAVPRATTAPRYRAQDVGSGELETAFVDFIKSLAAVATTDAQPPTQKQVRFTPPQPNVTADVKGKGRAAPQPEPQPEPVAQPDEEEEESFMANILHAMRSLEPEQLLSRMGAMPVDSNGAGPSRSPSFATSSSQQSAPNAPITPAAASSPAPFSPHSASFTSIDEIQHIFDALKESFVFPATLDFAQGTSSLPYTSNNAPVHHHEAELIKLLTKLDAVDSDGAESVRGARRALVLAIERELDALDAGKESVKAQEVSAVKVPIVDAEEPRTTEPVVVPKTVADVSSVTPEPLNEPVTIPVTDTDVAAEVPAIQPEVEQHAQSQIVQQITIPTAEIAASAVLSVDAAASAPEDQDQATATTTTDLAIDPSPENIDFATSSPEQVDVLLPEVHDDIPDTAPVVDQPTQAVPLPSDKAQDFDIADHPSDESEDEDELVDADSDVEVATAAIETDGEQTGSDFEML